MGSWLPRWHAPCGAFVCPAGGGRHSAGGNPGGGTAGFHGGHISVEPRINERIRVPEVRLVGPNGEQVGIVSVNDALRLAQEADLDLVEVAPTARPPVCKLMDYGKFKYESALKARESRKNQAQTIIKEIKLRPKIDPHDYGTKKGHVERFLKAGDKVKVTIMFRGREQSRPELGFRLLQRLAGDVEELGFVESALKARESRKHQAQTVIKEIKLRPKIDPHDYGTKKGHVERFLRQGDKVKVTIMFRGREQSRPDLGYRLLQRLAGDVEELGFVESQPKQDGRNMIMVIGPHKKKAEAKANPGRSQNPAEAEASVEDPAEEPAEA
jgi:translation initiation factor IF-3